MTHRDTDADPNSEPSILVAGEALIDFLPDRSGKLADIESFTRRAGGAPANVAVALARLDHTPWFWTRIGTDPFGDFLDRRLREYGIPDRFIERDPVAKTSLAFITHDEDADRAFTFYRDGTADTRIESGTIPTDVLETIDWVHVGGVTLADEPSRAATVDLAERAHAAGCTVSFDPNARPELWMDSDVTFEDAVKQLLAHVDVVTATPDELTMAGISGDDSAELTRAVWDLGTHTVFLTHGEAGSEVFSTDDAAWGAQTATHEGYAVESVDTTGAGDAFSAGAIATLVGGERALEEVLEFANAVAAVATSAAGAMTALPDRDAVRAFRASR